MIKLLLSVAFFIAAVTTFCAAIAVVAFYRWITRDERRQEPRTSFTSSRTTSIRVAACRCAACSSENRKPEYPRQTVADIVAFNAYRAAKKRGRA
jgi:hypothetical protein